MRSRPGRDPAHKGSAAEVFTVKNGKISESVLIFDRLSYGPPK